MRKIMLKWPAVLLAGFCGLIICVAPAAGAPLVAPIDSSGSGAGSAAGAARAVLADYLGSLGFEEAEIAVRLEGLSDAEAHRLAGSLDTVLAGGESETRKAAGVGLVILITIGAITGLYLFYNANR